MADKFFSFSTKDLNESGPDAFIPFLPPNIAVKFNEYVSDYKYALMQSMTGCKSPIEMFFAMQMQVFMHHSFAHYCSNSGINYLFVSETRQKRITCGDKKYIVDFMIEAEEETTGIKKKFVVECDGYEFHSTKEQIAKDNERHRALTNGGYIVVRFSGSEIVSKDCAKEMCEIIISNFKRVT